MVSFAGFIITYNRPNVLEQTIIKVLAQTFPPDKIWIIDNSDGFETKKFIDFLSNDKLIYHRVGYNGGPALGASIGLKLVSEAGFDWILWGDDDDPPPHLDTFERQFSALKYLPVQKVGQLGIVGQRFNSRLGKIDRISDFELQNSDLIEVDTISGGQCKIINREVVEACISPNPNLFYGFEELDFDLKLKAKGFKSIVESGYFLELRKKYKRIDLKRPIYIKKSEAGLKRQYYSTRNLIFILKENRFISALIFQLVKSLLKSLIGFKFGWKYGSRNFDNVMKGVAHGLAGNLSNNLLIPSGR